MRRTLQLCSLTLAVLPACGAPEDSSPPAVPVGAVAFIDEDPDPGHIEITVVAGPARWEYLPGKPADVWAYSDANAPDAAAQVPGPMLVGRVGDRVTVHLRNALPETTTIHWHGLKVPAAHDGSHVSQKPVMPGETFTYEFTLTDAGTFWFHPHLDSENQIERGLYAPIVVRGGGADDIDIEVDAERMFVLDDVKVESTGKLSETITPLDLMVGRLGNVLLVNGRKQPQLSTRAGARERWRLLNAANGTFFNVTLPGHKLRVIAWDGGLLPEPYETDTLVIAPGERYEVLVDLAGGDGDTLTLQTLFYDRGHDLPDFGPRPLLTLELDGAVTGPRPALPTKWGDVKALAVDASTPVRKLLLEEEEAATPADEPRFFINKEAFPDVTPISVGMDDLEIWEVTNDATMDHPFHLHGTFFQVLDQPVLGWKDTVNVPQKGTVRFAVRFDNPGAWMFHCHILEHADRGMMGLLDVKH